MYRKILFPIKFEEFSLDVLSCVLNFKRAGMEEIVLLHVIDVSQLPMDKYEGYHPDDIKRFTALAEAKMAEPAGMIEQAGLWAKKRIEVGVPYREILRVAEEEGVSLIVSGRQKKGVIGEIFIGSNTDKVIRYGKFPVYVPKYPAICGGDKAACDRYCTTPFDKVLYPTDWSDCAAAALRYLKGLKNAGIEEVVVAHVMDEKAMSMQPAEKVKEFERIDREKLQKVEAELENEGFKVSTRLHLGKPGADLIRIAQQEDAALIVMGSHGKGYVEGMLWGSVSRKVIEYSDRPVLVIKR